MDQLSKRYADPCFLLDGAISTGRFQEFVDETCRIIAKEKEDQSNWEFFLHKVWEGSYSDFLEKQKNDKELIAMPEEKSEAIVKNSLDILKGFNPNT